MITIQEISTENAIIEIKFIKDDNDILSNEVMSAILRTRLGEGFDVQFTDGKTPDGMFGVLSFHKSNDSHVVKLHYKHLN